MFSMRLTLLAIFVAGTSAGIAAAHSQVGPDLDGEAEEQSGESVALSADGTILAVAAPLHPVKEGPRAGAVRVYARSGAGWERRGSDIVGAPWSTLGSAVSLSADGRTMAVGARNGAAGEAGEVRVFRWDGGTWQVKGGPISAGEPKGWMGSSVSLSADGETLAIGVPGDDIWHGSSGIDAGEVRVLRWNGREWTPKGRSIAGDEHHLFTGSSVALSADGQVVAVGGIHEVSKKTYKIGNARVFAWVQDAWVQRGLDVPDGRSGGHHLGPSCVALNADGNVLAVGSSRHAEFGDGAGRARAFSWDGSQWVQQGQTLGGESTGDGFGTSLALSADGRTIAVGAPRNSGVGRVHSGHVRVFGWGGAAWEQKGGDLDGEAVDNRFGTSVGLSADGRTMAVGAPGNSGSAHFAGHARVYEVD